MNIITTIEKKYVDEFEKYLLVEFNNIEEPEYNLNISKQEFSGFDINLTVNIDIETLMIAVNVVKYTAAATSGTIIISKVLDIIKEFAKGKKTEINLTIFNNDNVEKIVIDSKSDNSEKK